MIIKIVVLAFSASMTAVLLKRDFKAGAMLVSIAGCLVVFSLSVNIISKIGADFSKFKSFDGTNGECLALILKMLAVAYASSFGADICADCGEKALAGAVENAGRLIMLAMALPMLSAIFESVADMLG